MTRNGIASLVCVVPSASVASATSSCGPYASVHHSVQGDVTEHRELLAELDEPNRSKTVQGAHSTAEAFPWVLPAVRDIRSVNYTEKQQLLEQIRERLRRDFDTTKPFPGQVAYPPFGLKFRTEARNEVRVIDLGNATKRRRGVRRIATLALQDAKPLMRGGESWLQCDRAREARNCIIDIARALGDLRPRVVREGIFGIRAQCRLHVRPRRHGVAGALGACR